MFVKNIFREKKETLRSSLNLCLFLVEKESCVCYLLKLVFLGEEEKVQYLLKLLLIHLPQLVSSTNSFGLCLRELDKRPKVILAV